MFIIKKGVSQISFKVLLERVKEWISFRERKKIFLPRSTQALIILLKRQIFYEQFIWKMMTF